MKKLFFIALFIWAAGSLQAQKCLTDQNRDRILADDPSYALDYQKLINIQNYAPQQKTNGTVRIIPVVFHVIHEYGAENISKAQIDDAIRILNEDYARKNSDTTKTRAIFKARSVSCDVEFRLAKIDPNGNCTEGIVRVNSSLTNDARDNVKAVSYWNSSKYFNIWVVKSIQSSGGPGTVLGYAQFPGVGAATTDGVVVRNDCVGRIGTAASSPYSSAYGRTLSHEAGHYLGLFHTFQGGCNINGDQVNDTPPAAQENFGCVLTTNSCIVGSPDEPDMLENYMDYTDGTCQNAFTAGQKSRMDAVFVQYRGNLISANNLAATGVDGNGPTACAPVVDFIATKVTGCTGTTFNFTDFSYNGTVTNWNWTFTGADVTSSTVQNPTGITWSTPGTYSVSLTATNAKGSNSKTRTSYITVLAKVATDPLPVVQGFESTTLAIDGWTLENGGASATWQRITSTKHSGLACMYINNFSGTTSGDIDAFYSKGYNFSAAKKPFINFYTAYAQQATGINDGLKLLVSIDCGQTWQAKWAKTGFALAGGVAINTSAYTPAAADWVLQTYDLYSYVGQTNVRFRFEATSKEGNNLYIDDINILDASAGVGSLIPLAFDWTLLPNPTSGKTTLAFTLEKKSEISVRVSDVLGKTIDVENNVTYNAGETQIQVAPDVLNRLSGNVYFVTITVDGASYTRKLLKQ